MSNMDTNTGRTKLQRMYDDYYNWLSDTRDWRVDRDKKRKFYFGNAYQSTLSDKYKDRGWVDVCINKTRPLLRSRVSMMVASKPTGKIYGVGKEEMSTANALEEFMDFHFYNSDGALVMEDVVMSSQREGLGYLVTHIDPNANYGQGEIMMASETYENVFVNKTSRKWDFEDAGRVIHSKLVRPDDFLLRNRKMRYGDIEGLFHDYDIPTWEGRRKHQGQDEIGDPNSYGSSTINYIREFDIYDKIYIDVPIIIHTPTNTVDVMEPGYELNPNEKEMVRQGIIQFRIAPVPRIEWTKMIANGSQQKQIATKILPISHFPIVPVHDERTGNACSLGEVDFYEGLQELLNQSTSIMVLHATLSSLFKVVVDEGKIKDLKKWQREWAAPGAVMTLPMDKQTGKFPFEVVRPEPINNAFWHMVMHWGQEMEYEAMQSPTNWGDTQQAPETFSATVQLHEYAQNSLRLPLNHLELALQRTYENILEWSTKFYGYKPFDVIRNDIPDVNFINSPIPLPVGKDESGKNIMSTHDIRSLRARYRIRLGSTTPSQSIAYMTMYQQLAQQYPVFFKHFVTYLDIPGDEKRELIQAVDIVAQQNATIEEQQSAIDSMQKIIKQLTAQETEHRIQHKVDRAETQIAKKVAQVSGDLNRVKMDNTVTIDNSRKIGGNNDNGKKDN